MMNRPTVARLVAFLAWPLASCDSSLKPCMDGYARDNEGRCQRIVGDTGGGPSVDTNTAPTAPSVSLQPEAPRAQVADLVCQITSDSVDVDGDTVS